LFQPRQDTLVVYSYMYGPKAAHPCPMCTSMLDSLDGSAPHIAQRVSLAVVAKSPIRRIRKFAAARGWRHLRLLSSANNEFNAHYHGEDRDQRQSPNLNVFIREEGRIYHFYSTELMHVPNAPGLNERHVDLIWPLWNLLDLTPGGRGTGWFPSLDYRKSAPAT